VLTRLRPGARRSQGNPIVYFDIKLGRYGEGTPLGRILIELKARCAYPPECVRERVRHCVPRPVFRG
jgi:hypothetical protein